MKVLLKGKTLTLRRLSDPEYNEAERLARMSGVPLEVCLTCGARETRIPDSPGITEFVNGVYIYKGETYPCDCQAQIALRARYLLANIGEEYMCLDWEDFNGSAEAKHWVNCYVEKWQDFKHQGFGLEFGGRVQGIGKTFCATHIGKELIKAGQRVFFLPFKEMVAAYDRDDARELGERLRTTTFLILDEILPPTSDRQRWFFGDQFEALIRHRTNHHLPTVITTNMGKEEIEADYPRTYSLLSAKQVRIDMDGVDYRGTLKLENLELTMNSERRPIT